MKFFNTSVLFLAAGNALPAMAASWSFSAGSVTVQEKGAGAAKAKETLKPNSVLTNSLSLGNEDKLQVALTAEDGRTARRPHQAFLVLRDPETSLEESFPFTTSDSGKGKVSITHKDLPIQLLTASKPLQASIVIGSFGASTGYNNPAFRLDIARDVGVPIAIPEKPTRYGKLAEIHHIFRPDPRNPSKIITLVFTLATLAALPALLVGWLVLGANLSHAPKALARAPLAHSLFLGSIVGLEFIFVKYYTSWNLFQLLPVVSMVGVVAFLSGSRALRETQGRRLAGER